MSDQQDMTDDMLTSLGAMIGSNASPEDFARYVLNLQLQQAQADDPELAELLRACAIPRSFDAEVIGVLRDALEDVEGNQRLLNNILQFSFVQTHADGGYVYHDTTRDLLLADWQQQPEQLTQYQGRLAAFYQQRGQALFEQKQYEQALAELLRSYLKIHSR